MKEKMNQWLTAFLFYTEPWENFLIDAVHPFLNQIISDKTACQHFFVRSWDQGPHIRLYLKLENGTNQEKIKTRLNGFFQDYFTKHPSQQMGWEQAFPNNSIHYFPYEPETERFGGPSGITLSEKQFEASSETVLTAMKNSEGLDLDGALAIAFRLHLGLAVALDMDLDETIEFYIRVSRLWFSRSYGYSEGVPMELLKERRATTLKSFWNSNKSQDNPIDLNQSLWNQFAQGVKFKEDWLNSWIEKMRAIGGGLETLRDEGKLITPPTFRPDPVFKTPVERQEIWAIAESYLNMTNNRLGIINREEAYLGYLLKESLIAVEVAAREHKST